MKLLHLHHNWLQYLESKYGKVGQNMAKACTYMFQISATLRMLRTSHSLAITLFVFGMLLLYKLQIAWNNVCIHWISRRKVTFLASLYICTLHMYNNKKAAFLTRKTCGLHKKMLMWDCRARIFDIPSIIGMPQFPYVKSFQTNIGLCPL